jgi:hypothetical protein
VRTSNPTLVFSNGLSYVMPIITPALSSAKQMGFVDQSSD